jgi:hypothetical protein
MEINSESEFDDSDGAFSGIGIGFAAIPVPPEADPREVAAESSRSQAIFLSFELYAALVRRLPPVAEQLN